MPPAVVGVNDAAKDPNKPPPLGKPRDAFNASDFVIDGLTGAVDGKVPSFRSGQAVRVVVINVNPFLYSYSIGTENEQAVPEPSPLTFFNIAFSGLGLVFPSGTPTFPGVVPTSSSLDTVPDPCVNARKAIATADREIPLFNRRMEFLKADAHKYRAQFDAKLRLARVPELAVAEVQKNAAEATENLEHFAASAGASSGELGLIFERLSRANDDAREAVRAIGDGPACVAALKKQIADLEPIVKTAGQQLDKVRAVQVGAEAAYVAFNTTTKDPASYHTVKMLKRFDAPTHLTVTVSRRPVVLKVFSDVLQPLSGGGGQSGGASATPPAVSNTVTVTVPGASASQGDAAAKPAAGGAGQSDPNAAASTLFAAHRLTLGGRGRFSIAAGLLLTGLADPTFAATPRRINPIPGQSSDTTEHILTVSDSGQYRLVPTVALNVLLWPLGGLHDGVHFTLGAGVQKPGSSPTFGWYSGVGVTGFESRFMFTLGLYGARVQHLADFKLGQRLPTATVPAHSHLRANWALGALYRVY